MTGEAYLVMKVNIDPLAIIRQTLKVWVELLKKGA